MSGIWKVVRAFEVLHDGAKHYLTGWPIIHGGQRMENSGWRL
jgi:hypothetical protein